MNCLFFIKGEENFLEILFYVNRFWTFLKCPFCQNVAELFEKTAIFGFRA